MLRLVTALAAALVLLAVPAPAQAPAADLSAPLPLDPAVRAGVLPNGLRYFIRRNARPAARLELRLVVDAGSVLEDDDQRGLAHFLEHMAFNGTRRFARNEIVSYLESIGLRFGADLNAATGFDETVYQLTIPTDRPDLVERGFDILEDWAGGILLDSTDVANERGVVLGEWRDGLGAGARIRDRQLPVYFHGSRYAERLPIGRREVIEAATPAPIRRFYRDWYRPDLLAVVAVGDADPDRLEALVRARFGGLRGPEPERPRPLVELPPHEQTLVTVATDPEQQATTVAVLHKHPARTPRTVGDLRDALVQQLADLILNQRFAELGERADAPYVVAGAGLGDLVRSARAYQLAAVAKDGRALDALAVLLSEGRRARVHGFLPAEFERARTDLRRRLERAWLERDKSESGGLAGGLVAHALTGQPMPGADFTWEAGQALLPGITLAEVNAAAGRWITDRNRVIAVAAPEKPGVPVPTEAQLLAVFRMVDSISPPPWIERVSDAPLVAVPPEPGRVTRTRTIPEIGVTEWTLANGTRVLVKPTDFKADEVRFRAWSQGGLSLLPDSLVLDGAVAATAAERGGLATFEAAELRKKLSGRVAGASPYVGVTDEGMAGGAAPRDLETLLQLVHLRFTAPRADSLAFEGFRAQLATVLANQASDPDAVFGDTVAATFAQGSPRVVRLDTASVRRLSLGRAFRIYEERFADAGDFAFVFVGRVEPDSLRPLVERWIGGLPSYGLRERWRPVGPPPLRGRVDKVVRKGVEPRSRQVVVFTAEDRSTPESRHVMRSLAAVLEQRLLEELREELAGTYAVEVSGEVRSAPRRAAEVTIQFGSAPELADSMYAAALAVVDRVRREGPTAEEVRKVQEQQRREYEVSVRENDYWAYNLAARDEAGEDPRGLVRYPALIDRLTPAAIRQAARRYLDPANLARFVLLPEAP